MILRTGRGGDRREGPRTAIRFRALAQGGEPDLEAVRALLQHLQDEELNDGTAWTQMKHYVSRWLKELEER